MQNHTIGFIFQPCLFNVTVLNYLFMLLHRSADCIIKIVNLKKKNIYVYIRENNNSGFIKIFYIS